MQRSRYGIAVSGCALAVELVDEERINATYVIQNVLFLLVSQGHDGNRVPFSILPGASTSQDEKKSGDCIMVNQWGLSRMDRPNAFTTSM
jgi:hypothetical protein